MILCRTRGGQHAMYTASTIMLCLHLYVFIVQYCAGDKIEMNEMGWACGAYV